MQDPESLLTGLLFLEDTLGHITTKWEEVKNKIWNQRNSGTNLGINQQLEYTIWQLERSVKSQNNKTEGSTGGKTNFLI